MESYLRTFSTSTLPKKHDVATNTTTGSIPKVEPHLLKRPVALVVVEQRTLTSAVGVGEGGLARGVIKGCHLSLFSTPSIHTFQSSFFLHILYFGYEMRPSGQRRWRRWRRRRRRRRRTQCLLCGRRKERP